MRLRIVCALAIGAALSGCGRPHFVGRPDLQFVQNQQLPAPMREDFTMPPRPSVIGPSDRLSVDVFGIEELSRTVTVDINGQIALPLIGPLEVSGMTTNELAEDVTTRLRNQHVRDPKVTVNVETAASQVVTVDGEVDTPGIYPLVGRQSLMRAVARAGGTTEFALEDYVVVYRTSGGQKYAALYDLRAIRAGMYEDPEIFSNDVIYVGESHARRVFKDVLSASTLITAPVIALLR